MSPMMSWETRKNGFENADYMNVGMNKCLCCSRANRRWWLMPVIIATQEAEIRRIVVRS
jgi:hypothetical protein